MNYSHALKLVEQYGTPTLFISETAVREAYRSLKSSLPGTTLYYAVKSNCNADIIRIIDREGGFFDVCTNGEIDIIRSCGITGDRCIHTHPIKRDSDIRYALDNSIFTMVADNAWELEKFVPYKDTVKVLIRLSIQNPTCLVNLSQKFGVAPDKALDLVLKGHRMGLHIEGLSFHIGSQNENVLKYMEALDYCHDICRMAALSGAHLKTIDIGGGFPIDYLSPVMPIAPYLQPVNEYLENYFTSYRVIAEPGRFVCGSAVTLATRVIGKSMRDGIRWYYIDDGLYGSFSGKMYDHADYPMYVSRTGERFTSTIAGPTCDSIDVPYEKISLPEMEIGDLLLFSSMGAYTSASASTFNGFPKPKEILIK